MAGPGEAPDVLVASFTAEVAVGEGAEERLTIGRGGRAGAPAAEPLGRPSHRCIAASVLAAFGVACIVVLAALSASAEAGGEEAASIGASGSAWAPGAEVAAARRASAQQGAAGACRKVEEGEPCHRFVTWAMGEGIRTRKDLFPGLTESSTFDDFQDALRGEPYAGCPRPCGRAGGEMNDTVGVRSALAWEPSGRIVAQGHWCSVDEPRPGWALNGCGTVRGLQVKVLTYNLFWWNLFGFRRGNGGSAGHLIAGAHGQQPFDVMGFQECDGIGWVLGDAGLANEFAALPGPHALCMAYRKTAWRLLADGVHDVAEDRADQWYGTRAGMWVRLQHLQTGQTLFVMNHHGPLPLDSGGRCGGEATAFNVLKLIASEARPEDAILLLGDFNSGPSSATVQSFNGRLQHIYTGQAFGGVDHVLSSCTNVASTRNLGSGGSDHDALEVVIQL